MQRLHERRAADPKGVRRIALIDSGAAGKFAEQTEFPQDTGSLFRKGAFRGNVPEVMQFQGLR